MERVLGVTVKGRLKLYPLSSLEKVKILTDTIDELPVVIFSHLSMLSVLDDEVIAYSNTVPIAKAYKQRLNGKLLNFGLDKEQIFTSDGSKWNIFGQATQGPLKGSRLAPLAGGVHFAFAWLAFKPQAMIYKANSGTFEVVE